jgi:hypothetical protein
MSLIGVENVGAIFFFYCKRLLMNFFDEFSFKKGMKFIEVVRGRNYV